MNKLSSFNSDEIISILREEIENFDMMSRDSEVGTVVAVGDGIATIYGIDHAMYGEIVTFETGLKGMVQDIRKDEGDLHLRGHRTESIHSCAGGKHSEDARSDGLHNCSVIYGQRLRAASVYRSLRGNRHRRILHVSGKRRADCL